MAYHYFTDEQGRHMIEIDVDPSTTVARKATRSDLEHYPPPQSEQDDAAVGREDGEPHEDKRRKKS